MEVFPIYLLLALLYLFSIPFLKRGSEMVFFEVLSHGLDQPLDDDRLEPDDDVRSLCLHGADVDEHHRLVLPGFSYLLLGHPVPKDL